MDNRLVVKGLGAAIILLILVVVCWLMSSPNPGERLVLGDSAVVAGEEEARGSEGFGDRLREPLAETVVIRVFDRSSGSSLAGVEVLLCDLAERAAVTVGSFGMGSTGSDGVLSLSLGDLENQAGKLRRPGLVCSLGGYLSASIALSPGRLRYEFDMAVERLLTVLCTDVEGNPLPGARLYLSRRAFDRSPVLGALPTGGLIGGHELSVGVAQADDRGVAVMRGVASGNYVCFVDCADHFPIEDQWQGSAYVEVGDRFDFVCRMAPLMVLWVAAPKSKVRHMKAMPSKDPVGETSSNRMLLGGKASEFNGGPRGNAFSGSLYSAHVGILASGARGVEESVHGRVRWQGYDDVWREVSMPYRSLDEARKSGPMDVPTGDAPTSSLRLTVHLRNASGAELAGVPFRLVRIDSVPTSANPGRVPTRGTHGIDSGSTIHHVPGWWRLVAEDADVAALLEPYDFELIDNADVVVPLRLSKDIGAVRFRAADRRVPPPSMSLTLWQDSRRVMDWSVNGSMTYRRWLPLGDYRLSYVIGGGSPSRWKEFSMKASDHDLLVDLDWQ